MSLRGPKTLIRLLVVFGLAALGAGAMFDELDGPMDFAAIGATMRTHFKVLAPGNGGTFGKP